ncbi:MAG: hypothetical protein ACRDRT_07205, partial [Pseudonocardiaceae bacterium]
LAASVARQEVVGVLRDLLDLHEVPHLDRLSQFFRWYGDINSVGLGEVALLVIHRLLLSVIIPDFSISL